jgi:hypothetical protein
VATAKAPCLGEPVTCTMPSFWGVAASATTSGTGVVEADRSKVLSPVTPAAGLAFVQAKSSATAVG